MRHLGQPKSAPLKVVRFLVVRDASCLKGGIMLQNSLVQVFEEDVERFLDGKELLHGRELIPPNVLSQALVGRGRAILYLSISPCITLLDTESYIG